MKYFIIPTPVTSNNFMTIYSLDDLICEVDEEIQNPIFHRVSGSRTKIIKPKIPAWWATIENYQHHILNRINKNHLVRENESIQIYKSLEEAIVGKVILQENLLRIKTEKLEEIRMSLEKKCEKRINKKQRDEIKNAFPEFFI